jgi:hypothetical protein
MKKWKRVIGALMMAALLICGMQGSLGVTAADYAGSVTVTSSKGTVNVGDTVTVTVNLTLGAGWSYSEMDVRLDYDTKKLTYVSSANGGIYKNASLSEKDGTVTLHIPEKGNENYISSSGAVFTATFTVNSIDTNGIDLRVSTPHILYTSEESVDLVGPKGSRITLYCAHGSTHESETAATCTTTGSRKTVCDTCGLKIHTETIGKTAHTESEVVTKEATCTDKGKKQKVCAVCKTVLDTEEIPAMGHSYGAWKMVKEATADENGLEQRVCTVCGDVQSRTTDKLETTEKEEASTEATEEPTTSTEKVTEATEAVTEASTEAATEVETEAVPATEMDKTTEGQAASKDDSVHTGDAAPVAMILLLGLAAFAGILLVADAKNK